MIKKINSADLVQLLNEDIELDHKKVVTILEDYDITESDPYDILDQLTVYFEDKNDDNFNIHEYIVSQPAIQITLKDGSEQSITTKDLVKLVTPGLPDGYWIQGRGNFLIVNFDWADEQGAALGIWDIHRKDWYFCEANDLLACYGMIYIKNLDLFLGYNSYINFGGGGENILIIKEGNYWTIPVYNYENQINENIKIEHKNIALYITELTRMPANYKKMNYCTLFETYFDNSCLAYNHETSMLYVRINGKVKKIDLDLNIIMHYKDNS